MSLLCQYLQITMNLIEIRHYQPTACVDQGQKGVRTINATALFEFLRLAEMRGILAYLGILEKPEESRQW